MGSLTPRPLLPTYKEPTGRLGEPHSWYRRFGEKKTYLASDGIRTPNRPARTLVIILIYAGSNDGTRPQIIQRTQTLPAACKCHVPSTVKKWNMCIQQWTKNAGKPKYLQKTLTQCHLVHHLPHMHRAGIEIVASR